MHLTRHSQEVGTKPPAVTKQSHDAFVKGEFAKYNDDVTKLPNVDDFDPQRNVNWLWALCEGTVRTSLHEIHCENLKCLKSLEPTVAPSAQRAVTAKADIAANAILLPPITQSIGKIPLSQKLAPSQIVVDTLFTHPTTEVVNKIVLAGSGGLRIRDPNAPAPPPRTGIASLREDATNHVFGMFWCVQECDDETESNLAFKEVNGISCLYNKKVIKKGTSLVRPEFGPKEGHTKDREAKASPSKRPRKS